MPKFELYWNYVVGQESIRITQSARNCVPSLRSIAKAKLLKVGDKIRYKFKGIMQEGTILDIWGNRGEDASYSFKVTCGDSWHHLYPSQIIFED